MIFFMGADASASSFTFQIQIEDFTTIHLRYLGTAATQGPDISVNTWYQIGVKVAQNATCTFTVRDINGDPVGTPNQTITGNDALPRYMGLGNTSSKTLTTCFDVVQVDADNTKYTWE